MQHRTFANRVADVLEHPIGQIILFPTMLLTFCAYITFCLVAVQMAVCPLVYFENTPPTNPDARAKWRPETWSSCTCTAYRSAQHDVWHVLGYTGKEITALVEKLDKCNGAPRE